MIPSPLVQLLLTYKYAILAPAPLLFGPPAIMAAGFLIQLEYLGIIPTFLALAAGELSADILWYWLGYRYGQVFINRFGKYVGVTPHAIEYVKEFAGKYHGVIIFISKFTGGFGLGSIIMMTFGLSRIPFYFYVTLCAVAITFWTSVFLSIGYFLGQMYLEVSSVFERITFFALIIVFLVLLAGFVRYLRRTYFKQ